MFMKRVLKASVIALSLSCSVLTYADDLARGKYLLQLGGCNDCHTPGFAINGGQAPESQWLIGDGLGFRGPWGTTYASNLRAYMGKFSEDEWVTTAKVLKTKPPMPWWVLNVVTEDDLRAMYRFVKSLGPSSNTVPAYVPPDALPQTPVIQWPEMAPPKKSK